MKWLGKLESLSTIGNGRKKVFFLRIKTNVLFYFEYFNWTPLIFRMLYLIFTDSYLEFSEYRESKTMALVWIYRNENWGKGFF